MGKIFANRIMAGTIFYSQVAATSYKAATDAALEAKVAAGELTEDKLAELKAQ